MDVAFRHAAESICQGTTEHALAPGARVIVECRTAIGNESILVDLIADPSEVLRECYEGNNQGARWPEVARNERRRHEYHPGPWLPPICANSSFSPCGIGVAI
jgi:hypothetical protein